MGQAELVMCVVGGSFLLLAVIVTILIITGNQREVREDERRETD